MTGEPSPLTDGAIQPKETTMDDDRQNVISINGNPYAFEAGETILEVARRHDIDIPTLCYLKGATPTGACRVCVVEVEGAAGLMASCATPADNGMVVHTESPRVVAARRQVIELMLASGNHNCTIRQLDEADWTAQQLKVMQEDQAEELCPVWGDCRLQDLAFRYQATAKRYDPAKTLYPRELANPFIVRDFSRCIRCGRCVQACNEVQVNNAINFGFRGAALKIVAAADRPLRDSDCVFCGECVQACPVGALVEKNARYRVRPWETTRTRTTCSYCGVGCQLDLHVADGRVVRVTGAEDVAPNYGSLCVKGRFGFDFIHSPERLTKPLVRDGDQLREATWDEALDRVARGLTTVRDRHGADAVGVLCSARITNEENYLLSKLARAALGTNNIDHCARL
jgi:predicted molibdopterin-dependent oxidoreductase YjgC